MILILSLSVSFIGCNIKVDPESGVGTITGELTKLSAPTSVRVENDIIKWSSVPNAGTYVVQIGDDSHQATTPNLEYPISSLLSSSANGLYVQVKALPSSSILYSESDWSAPYGPVDYVVSLNGFSDIYVSNSLGSAINLISGTAYESMAGTVSIFDVDKLYKNGTKPGQLEYTIGQQDAWHCSGNTYDKFSNDWSLKMEDKIATNAGVRVGDFLSASIDLKINLNGGYEVKKESETNQFYFKWYQYIRAKRIDIKDFTDTEYISQMLSDRFLDDAKKVNDGIMSAAAFINKYGTHVIMSAYYGGAIEASYYIIQHKSNSNQDWYANLETSLAEHLYIGNDDASIGGGSDTSSKLDYSQFRENKSSDRMTEFRARAIGGTTQLLAANDMEQFAKSYNDWAKSVNIENYAIIDVPDGSLYCIWDYLDDSFSNAKNILNEYLLNNCEEKYNELYEKIAKVIGTTEDTGNFAGGNGTQANPFRLSTVNHLQNLHKMEKLDAFYILENDIDMKNHIWKPLGEFTGTFDGKNHVIKNLNISLDSYDENLNKFGFCEINKGTFKNIVFDNLNINITKRDETLDLMIGSVCGLNQDNGIIQAISVTNSSIVGLHNYNSSSIPLKKTDIRIQIGGIVGRILGGTVLDCMVSNINLSGKSLSKDPRYIIPHANVGGIVGELLRESMVERCVVKGKNNDQNIIKSETTVPVFPLYNSYEHYTRVGSIVGYMDGSSVVNYCFVIFNDLIAHFEVFPTPIFPYSCSPYHKGSIVGTAHSGAINNCTYIGTEIIGDGNCSDTNNKNVNNYSVKDLKSFLDDYLDYGWYFDNNGYPCR